MAAVLDGAGLSSADVTPELARNFGQILRVVVSGVMDVMRSRQQIKDEFRMRMTRFRPAENNPLKFSANVDDALHNLLVKRNPAYLGPVEAFEDAFADLRNHQIAMLAGMRVAFEVDARRVRSGPAAAGVRPPAQQGPVAGEASLLGSLSGAASTRSSKTLKRASASLFGEEFARAYEEQLEQLKAQERRRTEHPAADGPTQPTLTDSRHAWCALTPTSSPRKLRSRARTSERGRIRPFVIDCVAHGTLASTRRQSSRLKSDR